MTTLTVRPIRDDQLFGARISGVTHDALADSVVRAELVEHFERSGLLIFEDVEPTSAMHVAISTVFGPLKDHPSKATPRVGGDDMLGVIELRHDPRTGGVVRIGDRQLAQWLPWHFDHCYNDELNRAGVLRAIEIPAAGGMTGFVDGIALYDSLSPALRERIEGETILYSMDVLMRNLQYGLPDDFEEIRPADSALNVMTEYEGRPRALHPAVWTRESGEKVLHVSPWMAKGIRGLSPTEADDLLAAVCAEIVEAAADLSYFHQWRPTDMVIWDNWRVLHSVSGMPPELSRCMHRTTLAGDYGLGRFETMASTPT